MRAVSVRVNEVIGVAGYVLPGTRVDVSRPPTRRTRRRTSRRKSILSNVQVLTAGTRLEQDQEKGKPMQVTVVTLLVFPEQSERLALASTEGKIQLALRNPLDQGAPETPGHEDRRPARHGQGAAPSTPGRHGPARRSVGPVTQDARRSPRRSRPSK